MLPSVDWRVGLDLVAVVAQAKADAEWVKRTSDREELVVEERSQLVQSGQQALNRVRELANECGEQANSVEIVRKTVSQLVQDGQTVKTLNDQLSALDATLGRVSAEVANNTVTAATLRDKVQAVGAMDAEPAATLEQRGARTHRSLQQIGKLVEAAPGRQQLVEISLLNVLRYAGAKEMADLTAQVTRSTNVLQQLLPCVVACEYSPTDSVSAPNTARCRVTVERGAGQR